MIENIRFPQSEFEIENIDSRLRHGIRGLRCSDTAIPRWVEASVTVAVAGPTNSSKSLREHSQSMHVRWRSVPAYNFDGPTRSAGAHQLVQITGALRRRATGEQ